MRWGRGAGAGTCGWRGSGAGRASAMGAAEIVVRAVSLTSARCSTDSYGARGYAPMGSVLRVTRSTNGGALMVVGWSSKPSGAASGIDG